MTKRLSWLWLFLAASPVITLLGAPADQGVTAVIERYVQAIGGAPAVAAATSVVNRGTFDNGRGLNEPYVIYARRPNQRALIIGRRNIDEPAGSGRGYDGRIGWDKNFIGTGLRTSTGGELADLARNAGLFRAARLETTCDATKLEPATADVEIVRCDVADRIERWWFDRASHLLVRLESTTAGDRTTRTYFEDYRPADGILTPFRERIVTPGPTIVYTATTIRYNETIDDRVFRQPSK